MTLSADGAEEDRLQTGVPAGPGVQWLRDELGLISTTAESEALAGLATGFWKSVEELESFWRIERVFEPVMPGDRREYLFGEWRRAVARCRSGSC